MKFKTLTAYVHFRIYNIQLDPNSLKSFRNNSSIFVEFLHRC